MMAAGTVHMAMQDLIGRSIAAVNDLDTKMQVLTRHRMIGIDRHVAAYDLDDRDQPVHPVFFDLEHIPDLKIIRGELIAGHFGHQ